MFETVLKIILTVAMLYLGINTFFKYQISTDRIMFFTLGVLLIMCIFYYDTNKLHEFILTTSIVLVIGIILKIVSISKKRHGYFLFNIYNKHYLESKELLYTLAKKHEIAEENINYNMCKPWLVIIKDTPNKTTNKLFRDFDKSWAKSHRKITMYNYWYIVVVLILLAALWRF